MAVPHRLPWAVDVLLVLAAGAGTLVLARRRDLTIGSVAVAIGVALFVAIAEPPRGSGDLWSYVMYGRIAVVHHVSPYTHAPTAFPHDAFFTHVSTGWRHTPSIYGPLFTLISEIGVRVAGGSALVARLWFQGLAALALVAALTIIWRRTGNPRVVALLGLQPAIILAVVNDGHNDLLLGLAVLVAVLAIDKDAHLVAGALIGLAALVKLTALLALVGLVVWVWRRDRVRALQTAGATIAVLLVGHAHGFGELHALHANQNLTSRSSIANFSRVLFGMHGPLPNWTGLTHERAESLVVAAGSVLACSLALAVAWWRRRDRDPRVAVAGSLAAYGAGAAYVLPWYAAWWLPLGIGLDDPEAKGATFLAAWSTVLLAAYEVPRRLAVSVQLMPIHVVVAFAVPLAVLAGFLSYAFGWTWPATRATRPGHLERA